jgi:hypothetical protein
MGRIRTIKPEFPQSESIGRLSRDARLLFLQLFTIADDAGRCRASIRGLASALYPFDEDSTSLLRGWLDELEAAGKIVLYEAEGSSYLYIPKWLDHQKIDKPTPSRLPEPSPSPPRIVAEPSTRPRHGTVLEGIGMEGTGTGTGTGSVPGPVPRKEKNVSLALAAEPATSKPAEPEKPPAGSPRSLADCSLARQPAEQPPSPKRPPAPEQPARDPDLAGYPEDLTEYEIAAIKRDPASWTPQRMIAYRKKMAAEPATQRPPLRGMSPDMGPEHRSPPHQPEEPLPSMNLDNRPDLVALHSGKRGEIYFLSHNPNMPSTADKDAWHDYYRNHLSSFPQAYRAFCDGREQYFVVPASRPEDHDPSYKPARRPQS